MPSGTSELCGSSPSRRATSFDGSDVITLPSRCTAPVLGFSILASARSRVDLPQAFGPMITVKDSSGIVTSRPVATIRWS